MASSQQNVFNKRTNECKNPCTIFCEFNLLVLNYFQDEQDKLLPKNCKLNGGTSNRLGKPSLARGCKHIIKAHRNVADEQPACVRHFQAA